MKVVFRVDASLKIGTGHVMRCLTLANALRLKDIKVEFICRKHNGHLIDDIKKKGFHVYELPLERDAESNYFETKKSHKEIQQNKLFHSDWLGVSQQKDAKQCIQVLKKIKADWLIVDHYGIDKDWQITLSGNYKKLMVIDDLADRDHECDLLLDQNLAVEMETRYHSKVPKRCTKLIGPKYALLQPEYAEFHDNNTSNKCTIDRILIFFGVADHHNLTGRVLSIILQLNRPDIKVDVIIPDNSEHIQSLREQIAKHNNIHLYSNQPTLATFILKADLAIGAGGSSNWERLCLGLPSLIITLAENQTVIAGSLAKRGLIQWLGHYDKVSDLHILKSLSKLVNKGFGDLSWSKRCLELVDGRGVERVCEALNAIVPTCLQPRLARIEDERILLEWANDPDTRVNSFSEEKIDPETHHNWFINRVEDKVNYRLYIIETIEGEPVGNVRFDKATSSWEVHFTLAPAYRGRELGRTLLQSALIRFRLEFNNVTVVGKVKHENLPSIRIFESLGFHVETESNDKKVHYFTTLETWESGI